MGVPGASSLLIVFAFICLCCAKISNVKIEYKSPDHNGVVIGVDVPHPRFSWIFEGEQVGYTITIHKKFEGSRVWTSGFVHSSETTHVIFTGELESDTRYIATISADSNDQTFTETVEFHSGLLDAPFSGSWIGSDQIPMNQLRKEFTIPSGFNQATAYISGIGYYELYVNGKNVDPSRKLDPGWTTFENRTLYTTFDLSNFLLQGPNAIGVLLGNGWYSREQYISPSISKPYGPPKLIFQLNIFLNDGSITQVVSDTTWTGRQSAIIRDSVYNGEVFDSRLERDGWAKVGFVDNLSTWIPASVLPPPGPNVVLSPQLMEPIRVQDYLVPKIIDPGLLNTYIYDFGQNFAGWARFRFVGPRGLSVQIQYSEILNSDKTAYVNNLRGASARDTYILKGDPNGEIYEPKFTIHGFRYAQIIGFGAIPVKDVLGVVVHSDAPEAGNIVTSNPIINQIQSNILWGQRSNLMSVPTDCPQRDERKGWMGDAALSIDEALFNFYLPAFYTNWAQNIRDAQNALKGLVPDVVPLSFGSARGDPNWATAYPTTLYYMYDHYGDTSIVADHYLNVKSWVDYLTKSVQGTGIAKMYANYGDWVPPPPQKRANTSLTSASAYINDIRHVAFFASLLGNTADYQVYTQLFNTVTAQFHAAFWNRTVNGYGSGLQSENVMALGVHAVPANLISTVVQSVVMDIKKHGNHLTTGIVGTRYLFEVLTDNNQHDLAVTVATQTTYPSYGYMFMNPFENATTLWELWDAPSEDPSMNSRNHIMFGSIGAWFYRYLAGIKPNALKEVEISPAPVSKDSPITKVSATYKSFKGPISVNWKRNTESFTMEVNIPHGTTGKVIIPKHDSNYKLILESGSLFADIEQKFVKSERIKSIDVLQDGSVKMLLHPGRYFFEALI